MRSFGRHPTISFPQQLFRIQIGIIDEKVVKVIHTTTERKAIFTHFLVVCEHDAIIISNTFCNCFLAESDKRSVAFIAFSSALRTNSSAVSPFKTGMFLIVMAIIVNLVQIYYLIPLQNSMRIFTFQHYNTIHYWKNSVKSG